jgi:hypothetical protein
MKKKSIAKKLLKVDVLPRYVFDAGLGLCIPTLPIYDSDVMPDGSIKKSTVQMCLKAGLVSKEEAKEMLKPFPRKTK